MTNGQKNWQTSAAIKLNADQKVYLYFSQVYRHFLSHWRLIRLAEPTLPSLLSIQLAADSRQCLLIDEQKEIRPSPSVMLAQRPPCSPTRSRELVTGAPAFASRRIARYAVGHVVGRNTFSIFAGCCDVCSGQWELFRDQVQARNTRAIGAYAARTDRGTIPIARSGRSSQHPAKIENVLRRMACRTAYRAIRREANAGAHRYQLAGSEWHNMVGAVRSITEGRGSNFFLFVDRQKCARHKIRCKLNGRQGRESWFA